MEAREHYGNCQGLGVGPMSDRCRSCWAWRKPEWNLGQTRSQLNAVAKDTGKCVNSQLSSSFFMFFPHDFHVFSTFQVCLSFPPFDPAFCLVLAQVDSLLTRTPDGAVATKVDDMQRPEKLRRLDIVEEMRPTSSNDIGKKKGKKKGIQCLHSCNMLQYVAMIRM